MTQKLKLNASKRSVPHDWIINESAVTTFGFCATHGAMNSVFFSRNSLISWLSVNHGS